MKDPLGRFGGAAVLLSLVAGIGNTPPAEAEWSLVAQNKFSYTTNVFQFSAARRLAFAEDPSLPTVVAVEEPTDVVYEPALETDYAYRTRWGAGQVSFKAHGFVYTEHPIFNHATYRFQVKQELDPRTTLLVRYRYLPNLFLGPNFERQTGMQLIEEERVTSHHWRGELERKLTDRWTAALVGRYGQRNYNQAFQERDTTFWTLGSRIGYGIGSRLTVFLGYLYERGLADGRNEPQLKDDVSYRLHHVSLGGDLRLTQALSLNLVYTYQQKDFTSGIPGDPHLGRIDQTHQGLSELRYRLLAAVELIAGFQQTQRTSSVATRSFNDTIYSIGAVCAY